MVVDSKKKKIKKNMISIVLLEIFNKLDMSWVCGYHITNFLQKGRLPFFIESF